MKMYDIHRWERAGIPFKAGRFPFGSFNFLSGKKNGNEYILDLCQEFRSEKFFGYYSLGKPMLVIQDLEMMKAIKTKDFRHFPDNKTRTSAELENWWKVGLFVQPPHRHRQRRRVA